MRLNSFKRETSMFIIPEDLFTKYDFTFHTKCLSTCIIPCIISYAKFSLRGSLEITKVSCNNRHPCFIRCEHLPELWFVGMAAAITDATKAIIIAVMTDFLRPNLRYSKKYYTLNVCTRGK